MWLVILGVSRPIKIPEQRKDSSKTYHVVVKKVDALKTDLAAGSNLITYHTYRLVPSNRLQSQKK